MTEAEAKQSVVALTQLMGWVIDPNGYNRSSSNSEFPIRINTPHKLRMADDWVKDVNNITEGFEMFCFYTWVSALNALTTYDHHAQSTQNAR